MADVYGYGAGQELKVPLGGKTFSFRISGVFRDYARQHGAILMDRTDYIALTGDRTRYTGPARSIGYLKGLLEGLAA